MTFLKPRELSEVNRSAFNTENIPNVAGFDGECESESQTSNRLAGRRTIYNLEKGKQRKKQIGTLDVAFKKRFFALNGGDADAGANDGKEPRKRTSKNRLNGGGGGGTRPYTDPRKYPVKRVPFEGLREH